VNDVAVLDDVFLPFQAQLTGVATFCFAAELDEIVVGDDLGADETALDVTVDLAGGLDRGRSLADRPGAHFVLARRQEADQLEQRIGGLDETVAGAFLQTEVGQKRRAIARVERGDLHLDLCAHGDSDQHVAPQALLHRIRQRRPGSAFIDVQDHHQRHAAEQPETRQRPLLGRRQVDLAQRRFRFQSDPATLQQLGFLLLALLLAQALETLLDDPQVRQDELALEVVQVARRIGRRARGRILESPHDLHERVCIAHLHQRGGVEHRAGPITGGGEIGEDDLGVGGLLRPKDLAQPIDALVRDLDRTEIRLRGVRIPADRGVQPGEGVEYGRFPRMGKSYDGDAHGSGGRRRNVEDGG
jgi:hypothetical protein